MTLAPGPALPVVDRAHLQQALDQAAGEAAAQARSAALLAPPEPDASAARAWPQCWRTARGRCPTFGPPSTGSSG